MNQFLKPLPPSSPKAYEINNGRHCIYHELISEHFFLYAYRTCCLWNILRQFSKTHGKGKPPFHHHISRRKFLNLMLTQYMVPDPQENTKHCFPPPREAILSQICEYQWIYDVNLCVQFKVDYAHTFTCIIILIFWIECFAYADLYWWYETKFRKISWHRLTHSLFFSISRF